MRKRPASCAPLTIPAGPTPSRKATLTSRARGVGEQDLGSWPLVWGGAEGWGHTLTE